MQTDKQSDRPDVSCLLSSFAEVCADRSAVRSDNKWQKGYDHSAHLGAGQSLHETIAMSSTQLSKDAKLNILLRESTGIIWAEAKGLHFMHLFGEKWTAFMLRKIFWLDFIFWNLIAQEDQQQNDLSQEQRKVHLAVLESIIQRISEEVQIRYLLQQQGLFKELTGSLIEEAEEKEYRGLQ